MPDWLNPIFILRTQLWFTLMWQFRWFLLVGYLALLCCSWTFILTRDIWDTDLEIYINVEFFLVAALCFGLGVLPISALPKRYMDEDLIHYTALSDKQVLFGYIYVGMFYSGLACLGGTLVHLLIFPRLGINGLIPLGYFLSFFLISQMLNLFSASFFAGVRKQYEFILMGFMMYIICFILFGSALFPLLTSPRFIAFLYWKTFALYVPTVSACAYGLLLLNLNRKVFLPWKMFRTVFAYAILAVILFILK